MASIRLPRNRLNDRKIAFDGAGWPFMGARNQRGSHNFQGRRTPRPERPLSAPLRSFSPAPENPVSRRWSSRPSTAIFGWMAEIARGDSTRFIDRHRSDWRQFIRIVFDVVSFDCQPHCHFTLRQIAIAQIEKQTIPAVAVQSDSASDCGPIIFGMSRKAVSIAAHDLLRELHRKLSARMTGEPFACLRGNRL